MPEKNGNACFLQKRWWWQPGGFRQAYFTLKQMQDHAASLDEQRLRQPSRSGETYVMLEDPRDVSFATARKTSSSLLQVRGYQEHQHLAKQMLVLDQDGFTKLTLRATRQFETQNSMVSWASVVEKKMESNGSRKL